MDTSDALAAIPDRIRELVTDPVWAIKDGLVGGARREFSHGGLRFEAVELMWHWALRISDPVTGEWLELSVEDGARMEAALPGLITAYVRACDEAEAAAEQTPSRLRGGS